MWEGGFWIQYAEKGVDFTRIYHDDKLPFKEN